MKKVLFLTIAVLSFIILVGAGCASFKIEDRAKPAPAPEVLPEAPPAENVNVAPDPTAGWEVFRDEPWAMEIKYPPKYKTVFDTYGWPHALIHFVEAAGAQSYRAHIETWVSEGDFRATYGRDPAFITAHPNGKNFVTIDYNPDPTDPAVAEEWELIISTFRFVTSAP